MTSKTTADALTDLLEIDPDLDRERLNTAAQTAIEVVERFSMQLEVREIRLRHAVWDLEASTTPEKFEQHLAAMRNAVKDYAQLLEAQAAGL